MSGLSDFKVVKCYLVLWLNSALLLSGSYCLQIVLTCENKNICEQYITPCVLRKVV